MDMIPFQSILACAIAFPLPLEPCRDAVGISPSPISRSGSGSERGKPRTRDLSAGPP